MSQQVVIIAAAVLLTVGQSGAQDFVLSGDEFLQVGGNYSNGILHDQSRVNVVPEGRVNHVYLNEQSQLTVSGGTVTSVDAYDDTFVELMNTDATVRTIRLHEGSSADISGGCLADLIGEGDNDIEISGGEVYSTFVDGNGALTVRGGKISQLEPTGQTRSLVLDGNVPRIVANGAAEVNIVDGTIAFLASRGSASIDVFGGDFTRLSVADRSIITLHGYGFRGSADLEVMDDKVLGTGLLSGRWLDTETPWIINVSFNDSPNATLRVIELVIGDSNSDLEFNQLDFVRVLQSNKYMTGELCTWGHGDWNLDGYFNQQDIIAALQTGTYLAGPQAAVVPEPSSLLLLVMSLAVLSTSTWRRNRSTGRTPRGRTRRPRLWMVSCSIALLACVLTAGNTYGDPIPGLFNTGVDDNGVRLHDNDIDPHYVLIEPSSIVGDAIVFTTEGGYPIGGWLADNDESAWISPIEDTLGPGDPDRSFPNYYYRTAFDLTGLDPSPAQITGRWATDNMGIDILLNGISTGNSTSVEADSYGAFHPFEVSALRGDQLVRGTNTLDFVLNNCCGAGGPTGLRVEMTSEVPIMASFSQTTFVGVQDIGFGAVPLNSTASSVLFVVFNTDELDGTSMSLDSVLTTGDSHILTHDAHSVAGLMPGESIEFTAAMNTETAGDFESTTVLNFSDAEGAHQFLTLNLSGTVLAPLQAGDVNQDYAFDQLDLVEVLLANKYLTGQAVTWGEGDWDGSPGGSPGNPPLGDGVFDQLDIVAALASGNYLNGPYAAISPGGVRGDGQTSIGYDPATGELWVDATAGTELTSINIDSAGAIFTGDAAQNLGGSFDNDADNNIFKATFGSSFGSLSFGNVAQAGLSEDFMLNDLTVVGSLAGGGDLGAVDYLYLPEPSSLLLALLGIAGLLHWRR